ncbi:MAG: glycosyltransferase [Helicobacter sp.]|uniref:glycosyltransferase family 2 protein n=1 Tax=Helicobacter sp. TaxID=218 RepID=UPI0037511B25|nr:glycosyltransferase [Helicobacter sp.]
MDTAPFISIIIPVYNVEDYIARCLDSCVHQTFGDIEVIVVDDCGSDHSINITREYAIHDSRIHIVHNPHNLGTFAARLAGIKYANGMYMMFVDADDYLALNTCEKLYIKICDEMSIDPASCKDVSQSIDASLENAPDIVFFGMRFEPKTYKRVSPPIIAKRMCDNEILCEVFAHRATPPWHVCAKLYKASHIKRVREVIVARMGEDSHLTMAEDVLKSFYLCAMAKSSVGIVDKLYVYCESRASITRQIDANTRDKKIMDIQKVMSEIQELENVPEVTINTCFKQAQINTLNILQSVIELEHRYDTYDFRDRGIKRLSPYLYACIRSLRFHRKWQTYIRILVYLMTFGKVKI